MSGEHVRAKSLFQLDPRLGYAASGFVLTIAEMLTCSRVIGSRQATSLRLVYQGGWKSVKVSFGVFDEKKKKAEEPGRKSGRHGSAL